MINLLAQTVTPTPVSDSLDIGTFVQTTVNQAIGIDVVLLLRIVFIWSAIVWLIFVFWVAIDALQRYKNPIVPFLWFVFVLPFNILGLIGYLFIRPNNTLDEKEWSKLENKYLMAELTKVNDCPRCGTTLAENNPFCPICGTSMTVKCSECNHEQNVYNNFCVSCGKELKKEAFTNEPELKVNTGTQISGISDKVTTVKQNLFGALSSLKSRVSAKKTVDTNKEGDSVKKK